MKARSRDSPLAAYRGGQEGIDPPPFHLQRVRLCDLFDLCCGNKNADCSKPGSLNEVWYLPWSCQNCVNHSKEETASVFGAF